MFESVDTPAKRQMAEFLARRRQGLLLPPPNMAPAGPAAPAAPAAPGTTPGAPPSTINIGGMSMPAPQAAQIQPLPQQQPKPGVMGRIRRSLLDLVAPGEPAGYEGLLTPEERKSARPGFRETMFASADPMPASQRYQQNLDALVNRKSQTEQMRRAASVQAERSKIFQRHPSSRYSESPEGAAAWASALLPELMEIGYYEGVKELAPLVKGGGSGGDDAKAQQATGKDWTTVFDPKNHPEAPYWNPDSNQWQKSIPRGLPADQVEHNQANESAALARIDAARARLELSGQAFESRQLTNDAKAFNTQIKPIRDRAALIEQAIMTMDAAAHSADPNERKILYSSSIANFVQAADQKAQLRWQLLNYFKNNVDPSVAGKWNLLKERLINGKLPQYTMEGMLKHLHALKDLTSREFEAQRAGKIKAKPGLDDFLPTLDEIFPSGAGTPDTDTSAIEALYKQFNLMPPKPTP
jgi:hypothetical protein